jgi:ribosome modulation factor
MADQDASPTAQVPDDRLRRAYDDGFAAATSGEEAAPGCTTTAEGRAFLRGYVEGARTRGAVAGQD